MKSKENFNINQKKAIETIKGPVLVLAGPGSGKTHTLINRIYNMVKTNHIDPRNILTITFTRKAANEMKHRYISLSKEDKNLDIPTFGTFHSIFYMILREDFSYNSNSLITRDEERKYLISILEKDKSINIKYELLDSIIEDFNRENLAREKGEVFLPKTLSKNKYNALRKKYDELLFDNKKLTFHGMIENCYNLLSTHKDILKKYQDKYKYILVDEFQDINNEQYRILKLICKSKNIFVVGDDDQSIYKFRGSNPSIINDFKKDYKNYKLIILNENYRCPKNIVKFSKVIIDKNKDRIKKDLLSNIPDGRLEIRAFEDSTNENDYIIKLIRKYLHNGVKEEEIAILYRTNILPMAITYELKKNNINFNIKDGKSFITNNFAINDILSYLRVAMGERDLITFMNIVNKPNRYISRESIGFKKADFKNIKKYYNKIDFIYNNVDKFEKVLCALKKLITPLAIRYIRYDIGYEKYLYNYCRIHNIDYNEIKGLLDDLEDISLRYKNIDKFIEFIDSYEENIKESDNEKSINLMTFHLSKGLEFKVVIIIDANDGYIPHNKSIENDLETERRLFYVAITRSKKYLHIFFTLKRQGKQFKPSRFITEALGG